MKQILNYIRDYALLIAAKSLALMVMVNLTIGKRFEAAQINFGEAFLIITVITFVCWTNYKSNIVAKLESIEKAVLNGNSTAYALGITEVSHIMDISNNVKALVNPNSVDVNNTELKEKGE